MKKLMLVVVLVVLSFSTAVEAADSKLRVVASFSILADMARQLGGDEVDVLSLVQVGEDAHSYQPNVSDLKAVSRADILLLNGLGFEGWLERLGASAKARIVVASKGVEALASEQEEHHHHVHEGQDPHAWHNVAYARLYAQEIAEGFIATRPEKTAFFHERYLVYDRALQALDSWVKAQVAPIPQDRRFIVTTHDAFAYFGRAYGISFLSPLGLLPKAGASAHNLADLIDAIKERNIKVLFLEKNQDDRLMQQIAQDNNLEVGGVLYAGSLSPADGDASSYVSMVRHNVQLFMKAMQP